MHASRFHTPDQRHRWVLGALVSRTVGLSIALTVGLAACGSAVDPVPEPAPSSIPSLRVEFEAIAARVEASSNEFLGGASLDSFRADLKAGRLQGRAALDTRTGLTMELLKVGSIEEAKGEVARALEWARGLPAGEEREWALPVLLKLEGIVYLRESERENCIARHNPVCCLFPLSGGGVHVVSGPARHARQSFLDYLKLRPGDLGVRWLLNIAGQALGDQRAEVPPEFLIDAASMDEDADVPRFKDVGEALGVAPVNLCGGSIVEDFDGDGLLDIVSSTYDLRGPMHFFRNRGGGPFEDRSEASGLAAQWGGLNCISADYDGDGDADILVLRGAWLLDQGQIRNSLLRNDGHGNFTDVTREAGLADPGRPSQAACFADFDGDGDLDIFVANESRREMGTLNNGQGDYPSQLFINDGQGHFEDQADARGVSNDRYGKGVSAGDYDNDGDMDLYVSNVGPNRLYRNDGSGHFEDVAKALKLDAPKRSFATWFFDVNNDGWLDLFVCGYRTKLKHLAADYLGRPQHATTPRLYLNDGQGGFQNVTESYGLDHAWLPMGANFGDVDGDGWLDIYLATGDPAFETLMPNVLLHNQAGRRFGNATHAAGLGHLQKGHGVAFGDLDNDGDQDLYHQLGGFYPDDQYANALFLNPGAGGHSLTLKLRGKGGNRQAIGARVNLTVEYADASTRQIQRALGSVSSFGGSPARLQIGLGPATRVLKLEIRWPNGAGAQSFQDLALDQFLEIRQDDPEPKLLERPSFRLTD